MQKRWVKKVFVGFLINLILLLSLQYYFFTSSSPSFYSSKLHYSKPAKESCDNGMDNTSLSEEDETTETELSPEVLISAFLPNHLNLFSALKLPGVSHRLKPPIKGISAPLYILNHLLRI